MRYINDRPVHIYGDSHTAGYESNHDSILGRNCFQRKERLNSSVGVASSNTLLESKMSRATKLPVFDFAQQQLPECVGKTI